MPTTGVTGRESGFGLSSEFWAHFVANYWCQRPCVFKGILAAPPLTLEDAFRGMVAAGEQYRANEGRRSRFYVEQALQQADVGKYLPAAGDGSIAGYARRIKRKLRGRSFGLVINGFQTHDAALYMRLRDFLHGLYEFIDVPANLVDVVLFLGNYKRTPFGLHADSKGSNNLTFVLAGRKRILAWPREFFGDQQNIATSIDYGAYRAEAIVLEGGPGDLLSWPSDYWHLAESCDSLPVTLGVGHDVEPEIAPSDPFREIGRLVDERLRASNGAKHYAYNRRDRRKNANKLPRIVASTARVLSELSRDRQLENTLRVSWLNRITAFGFDSVPPPLPHEPLADDRVVSVDPRHPVMWLPVEDDEIVCSANGHAFSVAAHPHVLKLLKRLNSGAACRVGDLVRGYKGSVKVRRVEFAATPKEIRALLEKLYSLRVITSAPPANVHAASAQTGQRAAKRIKRERNIGAKA